MALCNLQSDSGFPAPVSLEATMPSPSSLPSQPRARQGLPHLSQLSPLTRALHSRAWLPSPAPPHLCTPSTRDTSCVLSWVPFHPVRIHQHVPPQPLLCKRQLSPGMDPVRSSLISEIQPPGPWWPSTASAVAQPSNVLPRLLVSGCALCISQAGAVKLEKPVCTVLAGSEARSSTYTWRHQTPAWALYPTQHSAHCKLLNRVSILSSSSKFLVSASQLQLFF